MCVENNIAQLGNTTLAARKCAKHLDQVANIAYMFIA